MAMRNTVIPILIHFFTFFVAQNVNFVSNVKPLNVNQKATNVAEYTVTNF